MSTIQETPGLDQSQEYDAIIVGAGFAGLYMLHRLREGGFSARIIEAAEEVGGVWYWNRYPGARCDSESYYYSYTFSKELLQEWSWKERYAAQPEILQYLNHVADRLNLRKDIFFNTRVASAAFDETKGKWHVRTEDGKQVYAKFFINAVGNLTAANIPDFEGLDTFRGDWYHTAKWPKAGVDFSGKRVGVIGTGSTGIQVIPEVAKQAKELVVFQRTANFATPARNRLIEPEEEKQIKAQYDEIVHTMRHAFAGFPYKTAGKHALEASPEERNRVYEELWQIGGLRFIYSYGDLLFNREANETVAEFIRAKIREIVHNPEVAEMLTPKGYPYGTKRPSLDWGYLETFNRENVTLVDVKKHPIVGITPDGIQTSENHYALDSIVFATGFDAITGAILKMDIEGRNGLKLQRKWEGYPKTYLGMTVHGFPNMFMITGPGSPAVLSNMPVTIEQGVDWVMQCISYMNDHGIQEIEPSAEAEDQWAEEVERTVSKTLYNESDTWYNGKNMAGKPNVFMLYVGGFGKYRTICDQVAEKGYEGFVLKPSGEKVKS